MSESAIIRYKFEDELFEEPAYDDRFFITDLNKEKTILYLESLIRGSFEYKFLIDAFKTLLDVKSCVFFKGYSVDNGLSLEFHHHPFTLYDYTEAVVNKHLNTSNGFIYEEKVCKEVVWLHYCLMVGLVPLDPTSHQLVHDGELEIHPDLVIGEYENFYKEYKDFISDIAKEKYMVYKEIKDSKTELTYPENFTRISTVIECNNRLSITEDSLNKFLLEDRLSKVNNEDINKIMEQKKEKRDV